MTDAEIAAVAKRFDDAMMAFYALMKDVDRRDPRFMATMRRYGLIQSAQAMLEAGSQGIVALGRELGGRAAASPPAAKERAESE